MTKRDIITLLWPNLFFIAVAVVAFIFSAAIQQHAGDINHEKFHRFVANVQSGKWQLTTDRWLEGMRRTEAMAESYHDVADAVGSMMRCVCWSIIAGVVYQVFTVFWVKRKNMKGEK